MNKWDAIRLWVLVFTLISTAGIVSQVSAAPAAPIDIQISQPDGTTFTVRQWGDEWQNGLETVEGYTILQGDDGWWSYAALDSGGNLSPVLKPGDERRLAGIDSPEGLSLHIRPEKQPSLQGAGEASGLHAQNSGSQPVLVLLVEFSNRAGIYSPVNIASSFFGADSSVKDFYLEASFNKLTLAPAVETYQVGGAINDGVIGWLNLGYSHPNTAGSTGIPNQQIVKDALIAANPYINYASYDEDGNGYIALDELHIVVVVAGYERSYDNHSPSIWAHRWSLNGVGVPTLDDVVLGDFQHSGGYAQFGEIHGDHQATIGIMAHELGHDLTWPDLYDIDNSSQGVGDWSLMGGGSWNFTTGYPGSVPALPDAWLKWYQGWINPVPVNGVLSSVMISQSATNPTAYLLGNNPSGVDWDFYNHSGSGEYFLVENRNYAGYDAGLPGCGLLITHIDESVRFDNDANANEFHPLVKIIEADGNDELVEHNNRGDAGDPFPGSSNNSSFGYNTTPNSRLYSGADSQVEVSTTSLCGSSMSASLRFGNPIGYITFVYLPLITHGGTSTTASPVRNGDFEGGQDGNWIESSTHGYDLILQTAPEIGLVTHSGAWAAWLGGEFNEVSKLEQKNISLAGVRYLHYWYIIASEDQCSYDFAFIYVNGARLHSYDLCDTYNSSDWVHGMLDLNSYAGTTISLEFRVTTDELFNSNFFLDDISITASASYAPSMAPAPLPEFGAQLKPDSSN